MMGSTSLSSCRRGYEPGDIIKVDGRRCVVADVDSDKHPVLLLSLEEASDLDADSAARWASTVMGDTNWHLPTREEMERVRKYKSMINMALEKKGEPTILRNHTFYWTSTQCSESHTYACGPIGLQCYFKTNHSTNYRARAVKAENGNPRI